MHKEINIYGAGEIAKDIIKIIKESKIFSKINVVVTELENNCGKCEQCKVYQYKEFIHKNFYEGITFIVAVAGKEGENIKKRLISDKVKKIITVEEFREYLFSNLWRKRINKNMIVFSNFDGKGYGDNPKYICNKIDKSKYDCVWIVKDLNESMPIGVRKVKYGSLEHYRALAEAHFWVDNMHKNMITQKRLGQIYIQTWHGDGPLKKIEYDSDNLPQSYYDMINHDIKMIDYFISGSEFKTKQCKSAFRYNGCILEIGNPRNDIFFKRKDFKERIFPNLKEKKWILYAPTYREGKSNVIDPYIIINRYKEKYNNDCVVLIKEHPNMTDRVNTYKYSDNVINVNNYPDTQELLVAADILITDYSSIMWDYSLQQKLVILYHPDVKEYNEERGYYLPFEQLPYCEAFNINEVCDFIMNTDMQEYKKRLSYFMERYKSYDDGNAADRIVKLIDDLNEWY